MKKNLFNELVMEVGDYSSMIYRDLLDQDFIQLFYNENTKKGFAKSSSASLCVSGIYCLFKDDEPIYIGYSSSGIHGRIGRFFCSIAGKNRHDERHPAAEKYKKKYGKNFDDIYLKYYNLNAQDLPHYISIEDIEMDLIYQFKSKFNIQNYKSSFIEKCFLAIQ